MLRWIKKKVKKIKTPRRRAVLPSNSTIRGEDSMHIYEEINSDDVFVSHQRSNSLPATYRKGYPLYRPDPEVQDALYSIATIPGIDQPRPPSTSSYRRKLSFDDEDTAQAKPWSARVIGPYDVFADDSDIEADDDGWYEFDIDCSSDVVIRVTNSSSRRSRERKPSTTKSDTGREFRRATVERNSSLRSSASRVSDASSGFFSEDTDGDTLHRTSTRRKYNPVQRSNTDSFVRSSSRPKHHKVNDTVIHSFHNPGHPARGHFRQPHTHLYDSDASAEYLSPVKIILSPKTASPATTPKVHKRRSDGQIRRQYPQSLPRHQYGVDDVFKAYEIPQLTCQTSCLPSEPTSAPAHHRQGNQSSFWRRDRNRLLQDVIRGNYERQMCIFV